MKFPGRSFKGALPAQSDGETELASRLRARVEMLAGTIGERNVWHPDQLLAAASYIEQTFRDYALVRCFPKTGKTHQIRVHLKHIGLPLAVDSLYNPPRAGAEPGIFLKHFKRDYRPTRGEVDRPLIGRLTLHAQKLTFQQLNGERMTVEAELPKDLRAVLNQLQRHSRR